MSQYPGADPGQQPWGTPPQAPSTAPDQAAPGQAYPPGYPQPGYPAQSGSGYGQPGYPAQPGYPTQPGYPAQPGYPTQPAPGSQPNYGYQPQAYAAAPYQPVPVAGAPKSPVLGFIAVAVVVLAAVGSLAGGWLMLQELQRFLAEAAYTSTPSTEELQQAITGPIAGLSIAGTVGFAGWIAGIVAAATNRGRMAGIIAIVVGILAPIVISVYLAMSFVSMLEPYQ